MQEPDSHSVDEHARSGPRPSAAEFLRANHDTLLTEWQQAVMRDLGGKDAARPPWLIDHMPELLTALADAMELGPEALDERMEAAHAAARIDAGFNLGEVAQEYALLRRCILHRLETLEQRLRPGDLTRLEETLDRVVTRTMTFFWDMKQRILQTLDRMSEATLDDPDMETLLERLLTRLMESALTVNTAAVMLREDDALVVRAAVGLGTDEVKGLRVPVGQGVSGLAALERRPFFVRSAATDPRVLLGPLRRAGLRALYGLPLMDGERLLGMAYMGSRTAFAFSDADVLLFHAVAERASAHIAQTELHAREHEARQEAERSLALLDSLLDAAPVGIAFLDQDLRYLRINGTLARLNNKPVEDHRGRTLHEMVRIGAVAPIERALRQVLETGRPVQDVLLEGPDPVRGRAGVWRADYFPVRTPDGALLGVGSTVVDITDLKRAEDALQQSIDFREELIAVLGHDLRNPLHAVNASAFMLGKLPELDTPSRRSVDRIRKATARMTRMINDILDFARSRLGGGIPVARQHVNMEELCQGMLEELQVVYPERPLLLEVHGDDLWGDWDPDRVTQVLGNLVVNALQHAKNDSPVITTLTGEATDVVMRVRNEGEPIPPELLPHLFDPFKPSSTPEQGGKQRSLGLGLYIVSEIIHVHQGTVRVETSLGQGTTFTVRWPRVPLPPGYLEP
ncbi:PAS domain-containing protein [Corallococcus exiguus]|uniref:ATP-binding protein n=1 Tax=Corallococcus exiguus TaxID=83462 RepID=UPI000ECF1085|nr:ATP-binding protein [Corallococcus exiguus]NRD66077.1 PAS domain-containing protein [Corallococcus exiguus]RKH96861.1 GAF domain-containing protein [Corallococcus sp. AB030]RUO87618.1 GAF domain-containing protein [Corallococcus sp. AB018]